MIVRIRHGVPFCYDVSPDHLSQKDRVGSNLDLVEDLRLKVSKGVVAALAGAMPLSRNAYKLPIFEALVRRAVLNATNGA